MDQCENVKLTQDKEDLLDYVESLKNNIEESEK